MAVCLLISFHCFCSVSPFQNTWNGREDLKLELAIKTPPQIGLGGHFGTGYNRAPNVYCSHCKEYN